VAGLCVCLFLAATASGSSLKSVYLKDGGIIECVSFSKKNGMLEVTVNRDVVIELANEEVDLTRTFANKPAKPKKKKVKHAKKAQSALSKTPAAAVQPATKPVVAPAGAMPSPAKAAATPAAVPPTAKPGAAQPVVGQTAQKPGAAKPIVGQPAPKPGAPPAAAVQPVAKPGVPPAASVQPVQPAAKPAAASPVASNASPPQGKPLADNKPAVQPSDSPVRKPLPLITTKPAAPASASSALTAMLGGGMLAPILLIFVILIVSFWKIFRKAGEAGWKGVIPIYNMFVLIKIAGKPWWWFLLLLVPLVNMVIGILLSIALAKRFDQGTLFGLGLAFFGFIFYPVLAFGKATYRY
jgi:hypothetical protein